MRGMWIQPLDLVPYKAGQADKEAIHMQQYIELVDDLVSVKRESTHPPHELICPSIDYIFTGCSSVITMDHSLARVSDKSLK